MDQNAPDATIADTEVVKATKQKSSSSLFLIIFLLVLATVGSIFLLFVLPNMSARR